MSNCDPASFSAGYTAGKKIGYAEGFHDCLICMMKRHHDLLKDIMDIEKEYSRLRREYSSLNGGDDCDACGTDSNQTGK